MGSMMLKKKLIFPILLTAVLITESSAKHNLISRVADQILDQIFKNGTSLGEISLDSINKVTDVKILPIENFKKSLDGFGPLGVKLDLNLSNLSIAGNYDFKDLSFLSLFSLFGKGKFSVDLVNLSVKLHIKSQKDFVTEKYVSELHVLQGGVQNSTIVFENLMDDSDLADFINKILSGVLPFVVNGVFEDETLLNLVKPLLEILYGKVIFCIETEALSGNLAECIKNITLDDSANLTLFKETLVRMITKK